MYFLLTGEGNSDLGYSEENPGFLVDLLEKLAEEETSGTDVFVYDFVPRTELAAEAKHSDSPKHMSLRGNKRKYESLIFIQRTAEALGNIAVKKRTEVGAVFFHDCDFTRSEVDDPDKYYRQLVLSMESGFKAADYKNGVPMVPKPRSESWLLCHYQETPYENCARFEKLPGNDRADNSGKKQLAAFLHCSESEIYNKIDIGGIDWNRVDAPSFVFFKNRFQHVIQRLTHKHVSIPEEETLMHTNRSLP